MPSCARSSRPLRAGPRRPNALTSCLQTATDRAFADTVHSLDFINKAFECLDLIGWKHAAAVLPTVVGQMVAARGAEESTAWRQPADLVAPCARRRQRSFQVGLRPIEVQAAAHIMRRSPTRSSATIPSRL
jgi:hypothetical protein